MTYPNPSAMRTLLAGCALLFSVALPAQTASYTIVGSSCTTGRISPIGPVPFNVLGTPQLGATFTVETESSTTYPWGNRRNVVLFTGSSNTSVGGVPLPFDIGTLGSAQVPMCGLLRTSMEVRLPVPLGYYQTPVRIVFRVPSSASMLGVSFYQQVLSAEFSAFGPPFNAYALSASGHGVVGR